MGVSHLEIHTGKTKKIRAQAAAPTSPTPETGDIYLDTTAGVESLGVYNVSSWVYISLKS